MLVNVSVTDLCFCRGFCNTFKHHVSTSMDAKNLNNKYLFLVTTNLCLGALLIQVSYYSIYII